MDYNVNNKQLTKSSKTEILNGFRCLAALNIIFFHFCSKWSIPVEAASYHPGKNILYIPLPNHWGVINVEFFFVISGFVILASLERSANMLEFLFKRIARLFPVMLLCSVITFIAIRFIDPNQEYPNFHSRLADFLPSLTFTPPSVWQALLSDPLIKYVNGSYWYLFPQICFYLVCGLIFFLNRKKFVRNWFLVLFAAVVINLLLFWKKDWIINGKTFLPGSWTYLYFSTGILMYALEKKREITRFTYISFGLLAAFSVYNSSIPERIAYIVTTLLFLTYIYREQYLAFLKWKVFTSIGISSYGLYLIHENIGVVTINKLTDLYEGPLMNILIPVLLIGLFIFIGRVIHVYYEKPVDKMLLDALQRLLPKKDGGLKKSTGKETAENTLATPL